MDCKKMLKHAMIDRNVSAKELSFMMNKSFNYITSMMNKETGVTVSTLQAIADALNYELAISLIDRQTGKRIDA